MHEAGDQEQERSQDEDGGPQQPGQVRTLSSTSMPLLSTLKKAIPTHTDRPSEDPGRERDLADQEGEREAKRYPDQRGQGEFE